MCLLDGGVGGLVGGGRWLGECGSSYEYTNCDCYSDKFLWCVMCHDISSSTYGFF